MNTFYDIKNKKEILLQTIRKNNPNKSIPTVDDLTELGYPKLHIVYAYDKLTNFHIVEISPENIRRANNLYMDWEYNTIKEFTTLFPNSDILISDIDKCNDMSNIIYE